MQGDESVKIAVETKGLRNFRNFRGLAMYIGITSAAQ